MKLPRASIPRASGRALEPLRRRLALGEVRIRSKDAGEEELVAGANAAAAVANRRNLARQASADNGPAKTLCHSPIRFRQGDDVLLSHTFDTQCKLDRLDRIQLALRYDESWNYLQIHIEKLGALYEAATTTPLGDPEHWNIATWREVEPSEESNEIKTWTILRKIDSGPQYVSDPHKLKITLVIHRARLLRAWWEKLSRNYAVTLDYIPFGRYTATSIFLVILNIIGTIFSCSLVAYSFARLNWPGRDFCFIVMLAGLMIPPQVTMIPTIPYFSTSRLLQYALPALGSKLSGFSILYLSAAPILQGHSTRPRRSGPNRWLRLLRIYWHIMCRS